MLHCQMQKRTLDSNQHKDPEAAVRVTTEMYELLCWKIPLKFIKSQ